MSGGDARQAGAGRGFAGETAGARPNVLLAACLVLGSAVGLHAEEPSSFGTPPRDLMTSMGLATHVPEAKGFVQRSRPAQESLDFQAPYATDKIRPQPRNAAEVEALKRDLEAASARSRMRASKAAPAAPPPSASSPGTPR